MTDKPASPAVTTAKLAWSEDGTPVSTEFDDVYFSRHSGIDETRYVFLEQNRLPERLGALAGKPSATFRIGETGFGTGLNFLCAWQLRDQVAPGCHLQFSSVEKYPLTLEQLQKALLHWPQLDPYTERLLALYPVLTPGWHHISFSAERVELNLFIGDALAGFASQRAGTLDAWFLDGFAPAKNPRMWSPELFEQLVRLAKPGTTFSTFTAASLVREGLKSAGFEVERVKGYGRKRHMLAGQLDHDATVQTAHKTPWFILPDHRPRTARAMVIGAGLAGTSTAFSLARRGWQVSLLERHAEPALEGSGNNQGILYAKLSAEASTKSDFYSRAYLYATSQLTELMTGDYAAEWDNCGVLQLAHTDREMLRQQQFLLNNPQPPELVRAVTLQQAGELAGIELTQGGLFFQKAGWVTPRALCRRYLEQAGIEARYGVEIADFSFEAGRWQLRDAQGTLIDEAETVVIANAYDALRFESSAFLPLKRIRGQVTHIPATEAASPLKTVICGNAYVAPALNGQFHIGATFNLDCDSHALRAEDHQRNIEQISELAPSLAQQQGWYALDTNTLQGRVGFRCTSPDYLPLVGPVPDRAAFLDQYARLRKDATTWFDTPGSYLPGLYINTGHGSKGLVSCPLASELIAAQICGSPLPFEQQISDALNPARFLIRDLIRNKI